MRINMHAEVNKFISLIDQTTLESTKLFWIKYKQELPKLFDLTNRLLSIPATSAFIERLFSISGIVSNQKNANLSDDMLIARTMLKVNMKLMKKY